MDWTKQTEWDKTVEEYDKLMADPKSNYQDILFFWQQKIDNAVADQKRLILVKGKKLGKDFKQGSRYRVAIDDYMNSIKNI